MHLDILKNNDNKMISKLYEMCMKWPEKVPNTDVSKTCQKCNLLFNFDCLKTVSKFSKGNL